MPFPIIEHETPIFRNLSGVDPVLFENKRTNLRLAVEKIQNVVIQPGETFSFWHLVGSPTSRKGYREGMVISAGKASKGVGGGLCQLSNALFWLVLHSDMTVTERHRHSFDLFPDDARFIPFGTGATVVFNFKDLRFKNETNASYQFNFSLSDSHLRAQLLGSSQPPHHVRIIEREHKFTDTKEGLFRSNAIFKQILHNGQTIKESLLFQNYCKCQYSLAEAKI